MKKTGFTLIELMIVVAIIAIIAAIAIPNLLRSRMQSNESSAIGNLRTLLGAEVSFHAANYTYTVDWADLTTNSTPPFLDGVWGDAVVKNGYTIALGGTATNFTGTAEAVDYTSTGSKSFFVDASGVIRYLVGTGATVADTPIGQV